MLIHPGWQILADKAGPAPWCCDLTGLAVTVCDWPTTVRCLLINRDVEKVHLTLYKEVYLGFMFPRWRLLDITQKLFSSCRVSACWLWSSRTVKPDIKVLTCPGTSSLSGCLFLPKPGWSDSLSLWVLHNTAQTPRLLWSSEKASRSFLFRSLFSLFSKQQINQMHTHTCIHTHTHTRLTSSPFPLSIQKPVII